MNLTIKHYQSINEINPNDWDSLNTGRNPFLQYCFLAALENSGSVSPKTGWTPAHIGWLDSNGKLHAVIPLYHKSHSYGEYMFDWDWARGITQAGISYYPKAVSCVPFTPVQGSRLLVSEDVQEQPNLRSELIKQLIERVDSQKLSNIQCLFVSENESNDWLKAGAMKRTGSQFSWYNNNYSDFDDFLLCLKSAPRKKIKRERRLISEKNVTFQTFEDNNISDSTWDFFIQCYQQTYIKRSGHMGYLNNDFFQQIKKEMSKDLVIVCASQNGKPVASSLFIKGNNILYGRYWGAIEPIDGLHFECCYYQAIEYCIKNRISCLQPGTQGDYKRRRGFIPETIYGAYYFSLNDLKQPIQQYLDEETNYLNKQYEHWALSNPYKT